MARNRSRLLTGVLLLGVVTSLTSGISGAAAEGLECSSFNQSLLQRVKPSTGANLLTRSSREAANAALHYGYTVDKGVLVDVAGVDGIGLGAVVRLYRSGDFVWASEGPDADAFIAQGYERQSSEFFAASAPTACLVPVFRLDRDGTHRMATTSGKDALVAEGWTDEGVVFYAAPDPEGSPAPDPADTKFSVAVLPDTQMEMLRAADTKFRNRATWLADNKAALDLRYALQVGDLVNWGNVDRSQFAKASADIQPLEAAVPWAGAIGNHDTAAVCKGGSACPGARASATVRDTTAYNEAFPVSRFPNMGGEFEPGKVDNAYQTFSAGGVEWLVLSLELWPRASAVTWAQSVVASHPSHNVIVLTHSYLDANGSISTSNGGYGATSPQYLFDHLIKTYPNIKMVLSGHVGTSASRIDKGVNGNKIVSILQTFHSGRTNPVRLVEIDTAAGTVNSRVYAPFSNTSYPEYKTSAAGLTFVR